MTLYMYSRMRVLAQGSAFWGFRVDDENLYLPPFLPQNS